MWRRNGVRKLETFKEYVQSRTDPSTIKLMNECLSFKPITNERLGEWLCHTYSSNLKRGKMPAQAIANDLELKPLLPVIRKLCSLEMRLNAQIIPFSKIVSIKGAAYHGVKGESVCVPIEPDKIGKKITRLPRKLSDAELIPLMLKR